MMRKASKLILCLILQLLAIQYVAHAEDKLRFDFQSYVGEGQFNFFRVEIEYAKSVGEFCYFETGSIKPTDKRLNEITEDGDKIWSRFIGIHEVQHACTKFDIYKPFGWFYTQPISYMNAEYRFVFIGNIKNNKITGDLYAFRDYRSKGSSSVYRTVEPIRVDVLGVKVP
jgi:hypothetical protein